MCITCGCQDHSDHHHDHKQPQQSIRLEQDILKINNRYAKANRSLLDAKNAVALNFVSSPGSGKTTLLEKTITGLIAKSLIYVIEGDQQTDIDANRIRKAGADAYQINTGKACHLDAHMVGHGFEHFDIKPNSLVFIENVGNLICPAMFDLGEHYRVALISTTEGEDKPLKYPDMFYHADVVVINKVDLLPYVDFDINRCIENIKKIRSKVMIFQTSAKDGFGINAWCDWLGNLVNNTNRVTV
ncbi:hydrogenase nickel incorporation protein HypB [Facilibium subflavum]|uniref:hydrogenase nickel incorporation protein HypB n=1 Tax=Facilibium subflavum TaxID=2219058 RepID=UPI000E647A74|nr:hydrogenase nickel incorporation protein HypB [Facilibium subflavum]